MEVIYSILKNIGKAVAENHESLEYYIRPSSQPLEPAHPTSPPVNCMELR
jgi:hypothetical protein